MVLPDSIHSSLAALAARSAERDHVPAIAWGVVVEGELAAWGSAGEQGSGCGPDTVFRIASMSKSFTAAAVLLLRDRGLLDLDAPITQYDRRFASIELPTTDSRPITVRHLLSMSSGLATDDAWADWHLDMGDDTFDALISNGLTFAASPGTEYEYSNTGYAMLGRIIHNVSGHRPQAFITEQLLRPLGMTRTGWSEPEHSDWAPPFVWRDGQFEAEPAPLGDGVFAPMGGMWSCVSDLATWVAWFDDAFPARDSDDAGPLSRWSRREMQRPQNLVPTSRSAAINEGPDARGERCIGGGYGFGLRVLSDVRLGTTVHHAGGLPGYGSNMRWLPGRRIGVITLGNSRYAPMNPLALRMLEELHLHGHVRGEEVPVGTPMERAATALLALLSDWSNAAANDLFTDSVDWAEPYERRARKAAELGRLELVSIRATRATRASVNARTASGAAISIDVELSPHGEPRIQDYTVHESKPA